MATIAEGILAVVKEGAADDGELAAVLGVAHQTVNQAARKLEAQGLLRRSVGAAGRIVNHLPEHPPPAPPTSNSKPAAQRRRGQSSRRSTPERRPLVGDRGVGSCARDRHRDARRDAERLIIEAKGAVALQLQQVNYFLGALGELLQRMDDPTARYGLALPDSRQYRGLVERLPRLAKDRLGLVVYFVRRHGDGHEIEVVS